MLQRLNHKTGDEISKPIAGHLTLKAKYGRTAEGEIYLQCSLMTVQKCPPVIKDNAERMYAQKREKTTQIKSV